MAAPYKYRLLEFMRKLPYEHYHQVKTELPQKLGISRETFHQWMYTKANSGRMIYADHLVALSKFFGVQIDEMFTNPPTKPRIESINEPNLFHHVESRD